MVHCSGQTAARRKCEPEGVLVAIKDDISLRGLSPFK